jgi:hypothetical protein
MTTKFFELILDEHNEFAKSFHLQSRHANDGEAEEKKRKLKKKTEKVNLNFRHQNNDYYDVYDNKNVHDIEDNDEDNDEYLILQE